MNLEKKLIPGFHGAYSVTKDGIVLSEINGEPLSVYEKQRAAYVTLIGRNNKRQSYRVHTLVANAFLTKPDGAECIIHRNHDYMDNRVENLQWATLSEKATIQPYYEKSIQAAAKARSKAVIQCDLETGKPIQTFASASEAARQLFQDVKKNSLIRRCANGQRNEAYGFQWKACKDSR